MLFADCRYGIYPRAGSRGALTRPQVLSLGVAIRAASGRTWRSRCGFGGPLPGIEHLGCVIFICLRKTNHAVAARVVARRLAEQETTALWTPQQENSMPSKGCVHQFPRCRRIGPRISLYQAWVPGSEIQVRLSSRLGWPAQRWRPGADGSLPQPLVTRGTGRARSRPD